MRKKLKVKSLEEIMFIEFKGYTFCKTHLLSFQIIRSPWYIFKLSLYLSFSFFDLIWVNLIFFNFQRIKKEKKNIIISIVFQSKTKNNKIKEFFFFLEQYKKIFIKRKWRILLTYWKYKLKVRFDLLKWFFMVIQNKIQNKLLKGN